MEKYCRRGKIFSEKILLNKRGKNSADGARNTKRDGRIGLVLLPIVQSRTRRAAWRTVARYNYTTTLIARTIAPRGSQRHRETKRKKSNENCRHSTSPTTTTIAFAFALVARRPEVQEMTAGTHGILFGTNMAPRARRIDVSLSLPLSLPLPLCLSPSALPLFLLSPSPLPPFFSLSAPLSRSLSLFLSVCLSIYLAVCLSIYLSVCLSVCQSARPSVRPSHLLPFFLPKNASRDRVGSHVFVVGTHESPCRQRYPPSRLVATVVIHTDRLSAG